MAAKKSPRRTSHNPWDTRTPALCRERVRLSDVLLGPRPSLPNLRGRQVLVVRLVHRCRVGGGALARWPPSAAQTARTVFPYAAFTKSPNTGMPMKELIEPDSQARAPDRALQQA